MIFFQSDSGVGDCKQGGVVCAVTSIDQLNLISCCGNNHFPFEERISRARRLHCISDADPESRTEGSLATMGLHNITFEDHWSFGHPSSCDDANTHQNIFECLVLKNFLSQIWSAIVLAAADRLDITRGTCSVYSACI